MRGQRVGVIIRCKITSTRIKKMKALKDYPEGFPQMLIPTEEEIVKTMLVIDRPLPDVLIGDARLAKKVARVKAAAGAVVDFHVGDSATDKEKVCAEVLSFVHAGYPASDIPKREAHETASHYALRVQIELKRRSLLEEGVIGPEEDEMVILSLPLVMGLAEEAAARQAAGLSMEELENYQARVEDLESAPAEYQHYIKAVRTRLYAPHMEEGETAVEFLNRLMQISLFQGHRDDIEYLRGELAQAQAIKRRDARSEQIRPAKHQW